MNASRVFGVVSSMRHDGTRLYLQLALLLVGTFVLGRLGIGVVRYVYIGGCLAIGYQAWRESAAKHLELIIILFVWSPFLRRVVDFSAGFDPSGVMLVGPMLALLPPCSDLYGWLVARPSRHGTQVRRPYLVMGACLIYGFTVSLARGDLVPAVLAIIKFAPGMAYGLWLVSRRGEQPNVIDGATRGFLIAMPAAGVYGLYQYFVLPDWDSFWMLMTSSVSTSQGLPEVEQVRVFGPMNSAASFGHYMLAALLLLGFVRGGWRSLILCLPIMASLMLSSYRTGWIGLVVGLAYCWMQGRTRGQAQRITIWLIVGGAIILATTSFGGSVLDRLASFSSPSDDGSGQARVAQYVVVLDHAQQLLVGLGIGGFGPFGDLQPRLQVGPLDLVDGSILDAVLLMGLIGGTIYLVSFLWAAIQGLSAANHTRDVRTIASAAIVLANLSAVPLSSITRGEVGVLFWAMVGSISSVSTRRQVSLPVRLTTLQ